MKGVYGYREMFLRPQKSGKQAPHTCGRSAYARTLRFTFINFQILLDNIGQRGSRQDPVTFPLLDIYLSIRRY